MDAEFAYRDAIPALRGRVVCYHGFNLPSGPTRRRLELPTPRVAVVMGFGEPIRLRGGRKLTSLVAGPHTSARLGEHEGGIHGVELTLAPWAAFALFDVPMNELADRGVALADLDPAWARGLPDRLAAAPDWPQRFALLDQAVGSALTEREPAPQVVAAWRTLRRAAGRLRIDDLAADLGLSRRQLERRFAEQVGHSPKTIAQMMRLHRVLGLLDAGHPVATVAAESGFYDQPHLLHAFKRSAGLTVTQYRAWRTARPVSGRVSSVLLPGR